MDRTTLPLPDADLRALFAVLLVVHGALYTDELPDRMFDRLAKRLAGDGHLPPGSSKGVVNAMLAELGQKMHWAMGADADEPYPRPGPREVTHELVFPAGERAARAFVADLAALGGRGPWARPGQSRWTIGPGGEQQPQDPPETWLVDVAFGELPPDADFRAREAQLIDLAARHGGEYNGHHW